MTQAGTAEREWVAVCAESDLVTGSGVCALVEGEQVALFRLEADGPVYAVSNFDPLGEANVLSRGILGSIGDTRVVASPLYKQHYDLDSGQCLEDPAVRIPVWDVRLDGGQVHLRARGR